VRPVSLPRILPPLSAELALPDPVVPRGRTHAVDEALKLNIEDKEESSPRRPSGKRARPAEEQPAGGAASGDPASEGAGRPKRKAAPAPATEAPVKSRGKKAKTDAAAPAPAPAAAAAPASKAKKGGEKKVSSADDEAAKDQQEADEVDALADELAENGSAIPDQGAVLSLSLLSPLFFAPAYSCIPVVLMSRPGLQKLLTRLGQTLRQAVSSSRALKSKPSPLKRPNAPFSSGPVPEHLSHGNVNQSFRFFSFFVYPSLSSFCKTLYLSWSLLCSCVVC